MRKNKLAHLLEPGMRLYFVFLLLFAAASALFSVPIAVIEAAVVLVLYLYLRRTNAQRQREILKYIDSVTCNMDTATKDTMVNAPLPMVIFRPENDEVIWSNDRFLQITGEREHMFDTKITAAVSLVSNRWSRSPVIWRKRSLDQITSSFSGRKITMGRGALTMVSLVAVSMLQVTESI